MTAPSVSIVICTYNRCASLEQTLNGVRQLRYPNFEVVVVAGPCTDGTDELLASHGGRLKVVRTPQRNLSASRNLGIAAAAGEVVAFIDDDAVPDGMWLDDLVGAFSDPEVGATGGPVFDHTGYRLQARYSISDRWGDSWVECEPRRLDYLDHPDTPYFVYTMGTNSLFRRERLVELGGFDENFAFYLDETDVCLRLVDSGFRVVPQDRGVVHHKFLPSDIRNDERVTVEQFNVMFSRAYFAIRHGLPRSNELEMASVFARFVKERRADLEIHVQAGRAPSEALARLDTDAIEAWRLAHERAAAPSRLKSRPWFDSGRSGFMPFNRDRNLGSTLRHCIVTSAYPPGTVHGIGRACHALATGMASVGHLVHVITTSRGSHNTVDFEEGVWVHRIAATDHGQPPISGLPAHLWNWSGSVLDELNRVDSMTPLDTVQLPNWDAEGLATILDGRFRTVLFAYTPVLAVAAYDSRVNLDDPSVQALAEADGRSYELADLVVVSFPSTFGELESLYGIEIPTSRRAVAALGLPDIELPRVPGSDDTVEVLFIGRLEPRKGVDVLLEAIPGLCATYPSVRFTLAGDDNLRGPDARTYRDAFYATQPQEICERVIFTGSISDEALNELMAQCDIFVAPSRFESFGLMNLEAMRAGKPVVSTSVNGVKSVIHDGEDGILVPADDPAALSAALSRLIDDPDLRATLGANGRRSFETNFTAIHMAERVAATLQAVVSRAS